MLLKDIFFYEDDNKPKTLEPWDVVLWVIAISCVVTLIIQQLYSHKLREYEKIIAEQNITTTIPADSDVLATTTPPENTMLYLSFDAMQNEINANKPVVKKNYDKYFWIGDSRTVGLAEYYDINYSGIVGCGYDFLSQYIDSFAEIRNLNVIINLGVNDLNNYDKYLETLNNMPQEFYDNNNLYFLSINPCNGNYSYLNTDINTFNNNMLMNLRKEYTFLDCNSYLKSVGFVTTDGLHYDEITYTDIYDFVIYNIKN